jgi:3'-5' exoribonuclease
MTQAKPHLTPLGVLTPGQSGDFFALLVERQKGTTQKGKPYYTCRFRDAKRSAAAMIWSDGKWYEDCDREWRVGQGFKIRGCFVENERYGPQIDLELIRPVKETDAEDGFDLAGLVEHSRHDPAAMFEELKQLVTDNIADEPLRRLVLGLLDDHAVAFQRRPATRDRFYPFASGLLEHTLSVTKSCLQLVERYAQYYVELKPPLNRDLVVAGAVLHDLGRVVEIDDNMIAPEPTVPGRMVGHLILGRDLIRDKAHALGDVNPELVQMLEHIVLTHLALPEWGSPRLPLVPECLIIHHADDLDAKLEMYIRCLSRDQSEGPFTEKEPGLNRQLFKGRSV